MAKGYDKLTSIGTQKIHEATHISRLHIQAVIHESYDDMTKIQFLGFISILEREYSLDLSELKTRGIAHFSENTVEEQISNKVFVTPKKKKSFKIFYISFAVLAFIAVAYFSLANLSLDDENIESVDNTSIINAQESIETNISSELNDTKGINTTIVEVEEKKIPEAQTFVIIPSADVWVGYIDLDTHKKYQATVTDELSLDASKTWLLTFGHGYFSVDIDGKKEKYTDKKTLRFIYKDANMTKIPYTKWQELEKGGEW